MNNTSFQIMQEEKAITKAIDSINEYLVSLPIEEHKDVSLVNGLGSNLLFWAYYYKKKPNKQTLEHINAGARHIIQSLNNENDLKLNLTGGIAGISWLFRHITDYLQIPTDFGIDTTEIDSIVADSIIKFDLVNNDNDPIHGYFGKIISLVNSTIDKTKLKSIVARTIANLEESKIQDPAYEYCYWRLGYNSLKTSNQHCDLGIAHGLSGMVMILVYLYKENINRSESLIRILESSINFIVENKNEDGTYPLIIEKYKKIKSNRHAWCYGNLCVATALKYYLTAFPTIHFENVLQDLIGKITATKIADLDIVHDDQNYDAAFCHGSSGICFLLNFLLEMYPENIDLKKRTEMWQAITTQQTLKNLEEGSFFGRSEQQKRAGLKQMNNNLLYGYPGIGLSLISYLQKNKKLDKWANAILIF